MKKIIVIIMLLTSSILASCASDNQFTPMEYTASNVKAIRIDVRDREINISPSIDGKVHIDYFASSKEDYDFEIENGKLTVKSVSNKNWMDFIGTKPSKQYRKLAIEIPATIIEELSVSTTNENISIKEAAAASISLSSNGGSVNIGNLSVKDSLELTAKNGDIKGTVIGSYDDFSIHVDSKKGNSNLNNKDGGEKTLSISCNNGDINIELI